MGGGEVVRLQWYEFMSAVIVGLMRFSTSGLQNLNPHQSTGAPRSWMERLNDEIIGACAENAFCRARGIYWDRSINTFHGRPDAGRVWEVRATGRADGALIVRDNDPDDRWYVLVIADPPQFRIVGAMQGKAAKRPQWVRNPGGRRPSWFVPQEAVPPLPARPMR